MFYVCNDTTSTKIFFVYYYYLFVKSAPCWSVVICVVLILCSADNNLGWLCQSFSWGPLRSRSLRTLLDFSDTFYRWLSVILLHLGRPRLLHCGCIKWYTCNDYNWNRFRLKKSYKQPNSIRRKIRQYEMKLLRPKKISTLPAPDITGNLHGNDSKHWTFWQLRFPCGPHK